MLVPSSGAAKILNPGPSPRGWHRLQLAAECLQKYAWAYKGTTGKVDMKARPALARGSLFHLALAQHYARMRHRQNPSLGTPDDWCEPEEAVELMAKVEGVEAHIQTVLDTYRAYQRHFSDDEWRIKVLAVEELAQTTIGGKYLLTGRLDLAVEDAVGQVHVWDHKTTGRLTASHKSYYAVSGQLIGYSHMARQVYGERYAGLTVNLVQFANRGPDDAKFERIPLPRSPNMEARFEQTVMDIEESIARMEASGRAHDDWPKAMNEMSCFGRYGACDYLDQCRHGAGSAAAGNWVWDPGA